MTRRTPLLLLAAGLLLAGCGSQSDTDAGHNEADVAFAQQMVPHHEQAVEMAEMALDPERDASEPVRELATRIGDAQGPEIELMTSWLADWDVEAQDHGDGGHDMDGMMTDDQMSDLERATGADFDRAWLQMMVEHHEGAVEMAETEIADGQAGEAKELARDIADAQRAEIEQMQDLLS